MDADRALHQLTLGEAPVARGDHAADGQGAHHLPDLDGREVRARRAHHPRIAGSTEMWVTATTNSPSAASGSGASTRSKSEDRGSPMGRAARRSPRLEVFIVQTHSAKYIPST